MKNSNEASDGPARASKGASRSKWLITLVVLSLALAAVEFLSLQPPPKSATSSPKNQEASELKETSPMASDKYGKDWFDPLEWKGSELDRTYCTYIEGVCHTSRRFFYRPDETKRQPPIVFRKYQRSEHQNPGYEDEYVIDKDLASDNATAGLKCYESPIINHISVFSIYNFMLGEFYDWSIINIFKLMKYNEHRLDDFLQQTQLYIHLHDSKRSLLDSHHLFTSAFRIHPLLDVKVLLNEPNCGCFQRLVFCGYGRQEDSVLNATVLTLQGIKVEEPRGSLIHKQMREFLRERIVNSNPFIQSDIAKHRQSLLNTVPNGSIVVGFTQRSGRRRWTNLSNLLTILAPKYSAKGVALVEVNVEIPSSNAYNQVIRHVALDALIGVHGAQLTEAIWMEPGSLVVEFLPFVPDGAYGSWTKIVTAPTPLGVIFEETSLQHIGYPLGRASSPFCQEPEADVRCWDAHPHRWDNRDFLVEAEVLDSIIERFLVNRPTSCSDYVKAAGKEFVLYNINCKDSPDDDIAVHHYYRPEQPKQPHTG